MGAATDARLLACALRRLRFSRSAARSRAARASSAEGLPDLLMAPIYAPRHAEAIRGCACASLPLVARIAPFR